MSQLHPLSWREAPLLLALTALALVLPYASNGTVVLLGVALLALRWNARTRARLRRLSRSTPVVLLWLLLAWGLIASLWAPEPGRAAGLVARLLALGLAGMVVAAIAGGLRRAARHRAFVALLVGTGGCAVFLAMDVATGARLATLVKGYEVGVLDIIARGTAILVLLLWPVALGLVRLGRRKLAVAAVIVGGAVVLAMPMEASWLSLAAGLAAGGLAFLSPRRMPVLLVAGFGLFLAIAPALFTASWFQPMEFRDRWGLHQSLAHRAHIWRYSAELAVQRPLLGHGMDAARDLGRTSPPIRFGENEYAQSLPLHPHSAPLQVWLELGVVGATLALALAMALGQAAIRRRRDETACATAMLASALALSSFSFGAFQNWWIAGLWIAVAVFGLSRGLSGTR